MGPAGVRLVTQVSSDSDMRMDVMLSILNVVSGLG